VRVIALFVVARDMQQQGLHSVGQKLKLDA
jgi:hypothetical protein